MNLPPQINSALSRMNFHVPTPIQAEAIPLGLAGRDLIGCAQTGTGKTAAFSIPLLARLLEVPAMSALILAPTRELAIQITDVLRQLAAALPRIHPVLVIGGAPMRAQQRALSAGPRILVATPGRLLDHLRHRAVSLASVGIVVLDEADRMLDLGFAAQLDEIHRFLTPSRQTLLFSATIPADIERLALRWLRNPARVSVGAVTRPIARIEQSAIQTTSAGKNGVLLDELDARKGSVLVFTRTRHRTDRVATYLKRYGHAVERIHGDRSQQQRNAALQGFRSGKYRILVATDIAARGLDIPHIAHVINYDLPQVNEDYIHRIGRTARAGARGEALCLVVPEDRQRWREISRLYTQGGSHGPAEQGDSRKAIA